MVNEKTMEEILNSLCFMKYFFFKKETQYVTMLGKQLDEQ